MGSSAAAERRVSCTISQVKIAFSYMLKNAMIPGIYRDQQHAPDLPSGHSQICPLLCHGLPYPIYRIAESVDHSDSDHIGNMCHLGTGEHDGLH